MVVVAGRSGDHKAHYRKVAIQRSQAKAGKGPKGERAMHSGSAALLRHAAGTNDPQISVA